MFTVYDNTDLTMPEIEHVIRELCRKIPDKKKMTFLVHAEEKEIIENLKKDVKNPSEMSMLAFTRPDISEQKAVEQLQKIAQKTGVNLCIAHTSAGATVALQPEQRQAYEHTEGFLLETCPHYLEFTDEKLKGEQGGVIYHDAASAQTERYGSAVGRDSEWKDRHLFHRSLSIFKER